MKHWAFFIIFTLSLCMSCTEGKVYHSYRNTSLSDWDKEDSLIYDVPPIQKTGRYETHLGIRVTNQYPYTNLSLIVEQTVYPSKHMWSDTLHCELIDQNGAAKGRGVDIYQYHYEVRQLALEKGDSLHITVKHYMKQQSLPGISDVGVLINRLQ